MPKQDLIAQLKARGLARHLFWSYAVPDAAAVPDELLMERTLQYGDLTDLRNLFLAYERGRLLEIWEKKLAIQARDFKNNLFLAELYFHLPNAEQYLNCLIENNSPHAQLDRLIRKDEAGI